MTSRRGATLTVLGWVLASFLLGSCTAAGTSGGPALAPSQPTGEAGRLSADHSATLAQTTLDVVVASVLAHRWTSFEAVTSRRDPAFADSARMIYDNLAKMPLRSLRLRVLPRKTDLSVRRRALLGEHAWVQQVSVSWRVTGDIGSAQHLVWVTFVEDARTATIAGTTDGPDDGVARPLWWLATVRSTHTNTSTAMVGLGVGAADVWVGRAQAAASAVRRRLPSWLTPRWSGQLVLEIPPDAAAFEAVLGVKPGSYAAIAAVAWPEGPKPETAAVRIVVNPELLGRLDDQGRDVLLTHEVTHVATRSAASRAPTWLVEGFADYVAYASYPQTSAAAAGPALAEVRRSGPPAALPADKEFSPGAPDLEVVYAQSWLACRFLADTFSRESLNRFYLLVSTGRASVQQAVIAEFGTSLAEVTRRWRQSLLGAAHRTG